MKAGLQAHIDSITAKKENKIFTGKDITNPQTYKEFVADRQARQYPIPPAQFIKQAAHHWLAYRPSHSGGGRTSEIMVAQWSPTQLCWYHSNDVGTCAKPIGFDGMLPHWQWVDHIPVPENI